jgi:hypothetical protein
MLKMISKITSAVMITIISAIVITQKGTARNCYKKFKITEIISEGDKGYTGGYKKEKHMADIDGYVPTGKDLIEIASAVYNWIMEDS